MEDAVKALRIQMNTEYELSPNCSESQDGLVPTAAAWHTACDFVEVVGASIQISANGLYQKQKADNDRSGEDCPVYVHTSGLLYISFLSSICVKIAYVSCSPGWGVSETSNDSDIKTGDRTFKPAGVEDAAHLLAWTITDSPDQVHGNHWHEWNGTEYAKFPDPRLILDNSSNGVGLANNVS